MHAASPVFAARLVLPLVAALLAASIAIAPSDARAEAPAAPSAWQCRAKICQRASQRGEFVTLELSSRLERATWILLEPTGLENMKPLQPAPWSIRLEPGATQVAGILAVQDTRRAHAYQVKWKALPGNPAAVHDDRWHYRMPFGGSGMIPISQGYNGKFTHKGLDAYALDFPMPWGTPILASRGGTLVEVINDKVASGIRTGESEGDNRVVIEHVDGTFAIYAHLRHGGPARVGQTVESGELIGLSGDTGFSTGPHLHFEVYRIRRDGRRQSVPVKFWNGSANGFTAIAGLQYKPGCPRDGGIVCMPGELATERRLGDARPGPARGAVAGRTSGTPGKRLAPTTPGRSAAPAAAAGGAASGAAQPPARPLRRADGACVCPNRAVLHVDLPCEMVCGR
ncbi:MAG: M23 family metallopeptidase [Myxococcota bacterium]